VIGVSADFPGPLWSTVPVVGHSCSLHWARSHSQQNRGGRRKVADQVPRWRHGKSHSGSPETFMSERQIRPSMSREPSAVVQRSSRPDRTRTAACNPGTGSRSGRTTWPRCSRGTHWQEVTAERTSTSREESDGLQSYGARRPCSAPGGLEKLLTDRRIYTSTRASPPAGSHKPNTAVPAGLFTTRSRDTQAAHGHETGGIGQWGSAWLRLVRRSTT